MAPDPLTPVTGPPGCLSYEQAVAATGVTRRHLRRLVAAGRLEVADQDGRRWVTTSSLLAAGFTLSASKPPRPAPEASPSVGWDRNDELDALRREIAVLQALADERARELERIYALVGELTAVVAARREDGPSGHLGGDVPEASRRRWINSR